MKVPNAHLAQVDRQKIVSYLLNPVHRNGRSKARFFREFGYRAETWEVLAAALREHVESNEVTKVTETGFGKRFQVDGELKAFDGRRPRLRTVWQMDHGQVAPRLITAYPLEIDI